MNREANLDGVLRESADKAGRLRKEEAEEHQKNIVFGRCQICRTNPKDARKEVCLAGTLCPMAS